MDALGRLVESLALGDGFQVALLIVGGPDDADRAIGALQRRLSAQIERPALVLRLTPPVVETGISADALTEALIGPLPGPAEAAVVVLDGSGSTNRDEPAWAELFRRLNARRNGLGRQLGRPLVLCLAPTLEPLLAQQAPDLWSIRSARADVREVRPALATRDEGLRYEEAVQAGLLAELGRIYPDPRVGLGLLAEIGFPPARLPLGDAPDFWARVLRDLDRGVVPGGLTLFVRRLAREYPGNVVLDGLRTRARGRTRVDARWVRADSPWTEPSLIVDVPVVDELVQALMEAQEGRIVLVGTEGSGRRLALRAAQERLERNGWFVLRLAEVGFIGPMELRRVGEQVAPLAPEFSAALQALERGVRPAAEVLATLPPALQAKLDADPIARPSQAFCLACLGHAVDLLGPQVLPITTISIPATPARLPTAVTLSGPRYYFQSEGLVGLARRLKVVARVAPWVVPQIRSDVQKVIVLPSADPPTLLAILARRLEAASQADRLALEDPEMQDIFRRLASATGNPGAFLAWVQALLSRLPVPPPADWIEPTSLARIAWPNRRPKLLDDDLVALGQLLDGASLRPEDLSALLPSLPPVSELVETGLLTRADDDPSRLTLSPVAQLLRPSVQARLAAAT